MICELRRIEDYQVDMFASTVYIYSLKKRVYCAEQNADRTSTLDIRALSSLIQRLDDDDDDDDDDDLDGDVTSVGENVLVNLVQETRLTFGFKLKFQSVDFIQHRM